MKPNSLTVVLEPEKASPYTRPRLLVIRHGDRLAPLR